MSDVRLDGYIQFFLAFLKIYRIRFRVNLMTTLEIKVKNVFNIQVPVYDFKTNSRVPGEYTIIYPSDVVLVEGILIFYYTKMR